jgi:replication-associated recombination protein RarA
MINIPAKTMQSLVAQYTPKNLSEFLNESQLIGILHAFCNVGAFKLLLYGGVGSGKTAMIRAILNEYYKDCPDRSDMILTINTLKEQGVNYFRTDVRTFCQTTSSIRRFKKTVVIDDLDQIAASCQHVLRNYIDKYHCIMQPLAASCGKFAIAFGHCKLVSCEGGNSGHTCATSGGKRAH